MSESTRRKLIAWAAAAVMTAGGACFAAAFYRNAPRELAAAEIVSREPQLPELTAGLAGAEESSAPDDESSEKENEESSRTDDSSRAESSSAAQKPADTRAESSTDSLPQNISVTAPDEAVQQEETQAAPTVTQARPDAGTPSPVIGDGREAEREYFTTSIKDGETVSESTYFFTITQLAEDLETVRCDVELNGSVLTGYAGKCRLKEGANAIRVSCTYKDGKNKVYRAFRDYTVYLESKESAIVTDLTDRDVYEESLTFKAECDDGLEVYLNGSPVSGSGSYTVTLSEGENMIRLTSGRRELDFSVTYIPLRELDIITDLDDCTVYGDTLTFTAQAAGGNSPKLTVQLNGKALRGSGEYTAQLEEGTNTIRLLAKDGADKAEKSFTVTALPDMDEDSLPRLEEIDITDNMTVKGSVYSLTLKAADRDGNRIYSGHIQVACGGAECGHRWEDGTGTGYLLKLHPGDNSVYIRLTDDIGRQSEYFYNIFCESADVGEEVGRISILVRADVIGLGVLCEDSDFPVLEGETGFDTVVRFLEEHGFEVSSRGSDSSRYLARISKAGCFAGGGLTEEALAYLERAGISPDGISDTDSLGEFDYTPGSGWLYCRGGKKPSYAMSAAVFADGEDIELRFSLDFGNDVGSDIE